MQDTLITSPTEKINLVWDESTYYDEAEDEDSFDLIQISFENFLEEFDSILHKISPSGFFFVEGRNMGWRHLSGHLGVSAKNARSFISKAFPKTSEWSLRGSFDETQKILTFSLSHHDAPTGEFYTVGEGKFCEDRQEIVSA